MIYSKITKDEFKNAWRSISIFALRTHPFKFNTKIIHNAFDLHKYLPNLIELNEHKIDEYKVIYEF